MIYVIYHGNCFDGHTAAYVAWSYFRDKAEYIGCQHGDPFPIQNLTRDDQVFILDFSFKREILLEVKEKVGDLRVIDHHKTAQEDLEGLDFCIFDMNKSGALLTWDFFKKYFLMRSAFLPRRPEIPTLVQYVSDRDLWQFKLPHAKEIHAYVASFQRSFENWKKLENELDFEFDSCVAQGVSLLRNHEIIVESLCKYGLYYDLFKAAEDGSVGRVLPVLNVPKQYGSDCCDYIIRNYGVEACVYWIQEKDGKHFGIRSRVDFDCSKIAKAYGGGGHAQASGWKVKNESNIT